MGVVHLIPNARAARLAGMLLNKHSPAEIADAIEIMVEVLDLLGGDPDLEPGGDDEPREADGDTQDTAYIEWLAMRGSKRRGPNQLAGQEDDEEDDHSGGEADEDDPSGFEYGVLHGRGRHEPGCPISDPGGCEHDGREEDPAEMGLTPDWLIDQRETLPDAMVLASDRDGMLHHCARIQRTRCIKLPRGRMIDGRWVRHQLKDDRDDGRRA